MTMYLLKLNIALIVLFGFYKLMFSGDTFFSWRRATLIGMYLVAMLVPGLNCSYWINKSVGMVSVANEYAAIVLPAVTITQGSGGAMNWETTAMVIYNVVVCLLLLRFLWQLGSIVRLKAQCKRCICWEATRDLSRSSTGFSSTQRSTASRKSTR